MVLIDEKGCKIHATVRKQLLYLFKDKLFEENVYRMPYFSVAPSVGLYRTTLHPYKLIFQMKTKVQKCESPLIPLYGLSLSNISDVCSHTADNDYLVDVIGLMTGISEEKEYVRDGKITKMIVFKLTDHSGKVECALFGEYVDLLKRLIEKSIGGMPVVVVVVQFAKIKIFRDKASIQNVMNTTRLLINPDVPEAVDFKNRYKLKMCVNDGTGDVVFVLFDNDVHYLLEKQCSLLVSAAKAENAGFYPAEFNLLKDRTILFKIEKTSCSSVLFDGSYRVKRVCKDVALIDRFSADGVNYTPTKAIYAAEQDDLDDTLDDSEVVEVPTNVISADKGKDVSDIDISQDSQVDEFLSYKDDDSIKKDSELQSWWKEIKEKDHGDKKDESLWPKMQTLEELIETCTIIIWIASALHAAVNFGQYPYGGYPPNSPSMSRRLMLEKGTQEYNELVENPDKAFQKTITSQFHLWKYCL